MTHPSAPKQRRLQPTSTVLVVEHEILLRMAVAAALREAGFEVIETGNAQEALAILAVRGDIAAVVTDTDMSGESDGADLIRVIRRELPHAALIANSGGATTCDADAILPRPFAHKLVDTLRSIGGGMTAAEFAEHDR